MPGFCCCKTPRPRRGAETFCPGPTTGRSWAGGGVGSLTANGKDFSIGVGLWRLLRAPFWSIVTGIGVPNWLRKFFVKSVAFSANPAEFSLRVFDQSF